MKYLLIATLLALTPSSLLAWDDDYAPTLGGYVKGYAFQQAVDPWELERVGSRLQLALSGGAGEPATYYAALDFELDSTLLTGQSLQQRAAGFTVYPVEIYANLSFEQFEIRLGKQFIFWGRTSWVNPTDVISAWDYANIASEIEDYRVAPLAARGNWYIMDELMLDLIWVPLFQPHRIPIEVPSKMGSLPVVEQDPVLPGRSPLDGEFAMRLSHSISELALDWALAAYLGWDKNPTFDVEPVLEPVVMGPPGTPPVRIPQRITWTPRYQRMAMLGADAAKAIGPFVIKGETALKTFPDFEGETATRNPARAEYVAGLDYVFNENFDCGLQYAGEYKLYYDKADETNRLKKLSGRTPDFVEDGVTHQLSMRINFKIIDEVGGQVLGLYNLNYVDFMVLGFVYWNMADALKLYLGALAFGGQEESTPFGRQQDFSRVFVELKYSF